MYSVDVQEARKRSVNVVEAREQLAQLLDGIEAGEEVVILRRDRRAFEALNGSGALPVRMMMWPPSKVDVHHRRDCIHDISR